MRNTNIFLQFPGNSVIQELLETQMSRSIASIRISRMGNLHYQHYNQHPTLPAGHCSCFAILANRDTDPQLIQETH